MKKKLSQNLGYWDDSIRFMGTDSFTAVIRKNILMAVHPVQDRFFSVRELLHLMGMPHDYKIDDIKNINHVCQNVPVRTAYTGLDIVCLCVDRTPKLHFTDYCTNTQKIIFN